MIAAILARHGLRVGAYLSPHLVSFGERIRIDDGDLEPADFGAAVGRAARAAELVDRSSGSDDHVTQFEALTAAAYSELARQAVEVAVIEAGLGGRYDATNVIPSKVQVLTSVGLEHTRWLGPTLADIAAEKLAVVQPGATLVLGSACTLRSSGSPSAWPRSAEPGSSTPELDPGVPVGAAGAFQRRNFALARAAAEAFLGELDERAVAAAAAEVRVPGRLQEIGAAPLTLLDGAHNPDGMRALAESLPDLVRGHDRLVAVISILDDKDAAGMLAALLPACDAIVLTSSQNPRALPPPTLQSLAAARRAALGDRAGPGARAGPGPGAGWPRRRGDRHRIALSDRRSDGAGGPPASLVPVNDHDDEPSFLLMIGLVALIVAIVILVFFGIGYLFGRAFL